MRKTAPNCGIKKLRVRNAQLTKENSMFGDVNNAKEIGEKEQNPVNFISTMLRSGADWNSVCISRHYYRFKMLCYYLRMLNTIAGQNPMNKYRINRKVICPKAFPSIFERDC